MRKLNPNRTPVALGASLGECVHVAGVCAFLHLAEKNGYKTIFLGPAVPISTLIGAIRETDADVVGVSYRLTPETGEALLKQFVNAVKESALNDRKYIFGGTEPVAKVARSLNFFDAVFGGEETPEELIAFLQGRTPRSDNESDYAQTMIERIKQNSPFPAIRHHFGLPTMEATIAGIGKIAEARVLDVISLGTDQDAQENFFNPERQVLSRKGAGGVPVRSKEDFRKLYEATRCGNYPLMRTYAGTSQLIRLAEIYVETINLCFAAIPLFWFNVLDGRGPMGLEESIRIHEEATKWHGERNIPVEVNEPYHWSLRSAPDSMFVATAFLSAYIPKSMGVKDYISQYMFNTPAGVSFKMDLAKMLAGVEMVEKLQDDSFRLHRETRGGLLSYPVDSDAAKGHLASTVMLQMSLKPEILHIVGYCEADHAATADEVVESCKIARKVVENAIYGLPDMILDPEVQARKEELKAEATLILEAIRTLGGDGGEDPWVDPKNLANAVKHGFLDTPELVPSDNARGQIETRIIAGKCLAVDPETKKPMREAQRLERIWKRMGNSQ